MWSYLIINFRGGKILEWITFFKCMHIYWLNCLELAPAMSRPLSLKEANNVTSKPATLRNYLQTTLNGDTYFNFRRLPEECLKSYERKSYSLISNEVSSKSLKQYKKFISNNIRTWARGLYMFSHLYWWKMKIFI